MNQGGGFASRGVREALRRCAVYLSLCTIAVAQPLLQIYGDNTAMFTSADYSGAIVLLFAAVVLLVPPMVLALIDITVSVVIPRWSRAVHAGCVMLCLWGVVLLVGRAVTVGSWIGDLIVAGLVAAAATTMYLRLAVVRTWSAFLSPLAGVVAVSFVLATSSVISPPSLEAQQADGTARDNSVNVVWFVFDEAPVFPLVTTDGTINSSRFPGFARLASVSTWYRNATTTAQRTTEALPAMLTGVAPVYGKKPVLRDHPENVFTMSYGLRTLDVQEETTALCPASACRVRDAAAPDRRMPFSRFLSDAFVVIGHKILPRDLRRELPPIDENWGGFSSDKAPRFSPTASDLTAVIPERDAFTHAGRVANFEATIRRAAEATAPEFFFAHGLLPHRPWTLAPDMRISRDPKGDPRSLSNIDRRRDAYQSHLRQYVAVDSIVNSMITQLSASPQWDNTMLIVTSDHGLTFAPGESTRDRVNPKNRESLDDIYRIPLFIKYPGQSTAKIDDCAASSLDVVPTVATAMEVPLTWNVDGTDLQTSCPSDREHIVRWPKGETTLAVTTESLRRRVAFYDTWIDANGDVDGIFQAGLSGGLVGTRVPDTPVQDATVQWEMDDPDSMAIVGTRRFTPVPTRVTGLLSVTRRLGSRVEGLIVADGTIVGVVSELGEAVPWFQRSYFASPVMSRLITGPVSTIEMWIADWTGPAVQLRRVGPPLGP